MLTAKEKYKKIRKMEYLTLNNRIVKRMNLLGRKNKSISRLVFEKILY